MIEVILLLQQLQFVPEVFLIEEGCDLTGAVRTAYAGGVRMFVVCGGDGTISNVARAIDEFSGDSATLGIIPTGTQNNIALSLNIPSDLSAAAAILRKGRRAQIDLGVATCYDAAGGEIATPFVEACSVGLASALFPAADDIQHGDLGRVGDFLATLVSEPPAEVHMVLGDSQEVHDQGHVVLVNNTPYIGRHYAVGPDVSCSDGLLDVIFFAQVSKIELLGYIFRGTGSGVTEEPNVQSYRVRSVEIVTEPEMEVTVDGYPLGKGRVRVTVRPSALDVMVGEPAQDFRLEAGSDG